MLCLKTFPYLHRPVSPLKSFVSSPSPLSLFSPPKSPLTPLSLSTTTSSSSSTTKMPPITTVEHVVLFKVRESTDPSKIDAMISNLRSLISLDLTSHLTAGPILRHRSSSSHYHFTHLLHSRYNSKPDLATYAAHPDHQTVVKDSILPICDEIMAVDWVAEIDPPVAPSPGSAMRLTLVKPKEGIEEGAVGEIMAVLGGIKGLIPSIEQVSYGENFSPARAKGFTVGFISVFPGLEELDALDSNKEVVEAQKEKVRPLMESVIVVDYVLPPVPSASL